MVIIPFSLFFWTFEIFIIQNSNKALFQYNHNAIIKFRKLSWLKCYSLIHNPYSSSANWLILPFKPIFCSRIQSWITFCNSLSCFFALFQCETVSQPCFVFHIGIPCRCTCVIVSMTWFSTPTGFLAGTHQKMLWPPQHDASGGTRCQSLSQQTCTEHVLGAEFWSPHMESNHGLTSEEDRKWLCPNPVGAITVSKALQERAQEEWRRSCIWNGLEGRQGVLQ